MSNHIISGQDSTTKKAHPIKASDGNLHVKTDSLQIGTIFNNQAVGAGANVLSSAITQESNSDFVIYGEDSASANGLLKVFICETESGTYYQAMEMLTSVAGSIYGRFPIHTKFFKISYANTSGGTTNITIKFSSKN